MSKYKIVRKNFHFISQTNVSGFTETKTLGLIIFLSQFEFISSVKNPLIWIQYTLSGYKLWSLLLNVSHYSCVYKIRNTISYNLEYKKRSSVYEKLIQRLH